MNEKRQKHAFQAAAALKSAAHLQQEIDALSIQESDHIKDIHNKYEHARWQKRVLQARFYKYIHQFWYHVFNNHPLFEELIENDPLSAALLHGIIAIDCKEILDPEAIEHFFIKIYIDSSTAIELLNHREITLEYIIDNNDQFYFLHAPISWKKSAINKYCTPEIEEIQLGSFFQTIEQDRELALCIKEDLLVNPLSYYTPNEEIEAILGEEECPNADRIPFVNPNEPFTEFLQRSLNDDFESLNDSTRSIVQQFRKMREVIVKQKSIIDVYEENASLQPQNSNHNTSETNDNSLNDVRDKDVPIEPQNESENEMPTTDDMEIDHVSDNRDKDVSVGNIESILIDEDLEREFQETFPGETREPEPVNKSAKVIDNENTAALETHIASGETTEDSDKQSTSENTDNGSSKDLESRSVSETDSGTTVDTSGYSDSD